MSLVESLQKEVQVKILKEFQGFSRTDDKIFINLDNDYPLMYKKGRQFLVMENLYEDLVAPIREEAKNISGGDEEEFLNSMVSLLNKEVDSFFNKRFESFKATVEDFLSSQKRIITAYESRDMFEFLSDKGFQKSLNTKEREIDEFIGTYLGKQIFDDSERSSLILQLEDIKERFTEIKVLFFDFQKLMKVFLEINGKVKKSNAPEENKNLILNNLKLLQEISVDQMKKINISKVNSEFQASLFQKEFTVSSLVSALS